MTRSLAAIAFAPVLVACNTHAPRNAEPTGGSDAIELRAARGELEATIRIAGPGHFVVTPAEGAPLDVTADKSSIKVTRDGAPVLTLDARPGMVGMVGDTIRLVAPQRHGWIRIIDDVGVTKLSAEPGPRGGIVARDAGGSPIFEAGIEADRVVVQKVRGGERLATVHGLPRSLGSKDSDADNHDDHDDHDEVLAAIVLAAPGLPIEVRAAALAFVLSR